MSPRKPAVLRDDSGQNLRDYLIETAARLIDQRGSAGLTVRDIAREAGCWVLGEGAIPRPAAALRMPPQLAWRQLTGLPVPAGAYRTEGDERLAAPLLTVRGIIV